MSTRIWLAKIGFIQTRQNRICLLRQIRRRACLLLRAWRKVFTPMEYGTEWCLFCMTGGEEAAFDRARCAIADTAARDGFGRRTRPVAANRPCVRRRRGRFAETAARPQSILFPETAVCRGGSGRVSRIGTVAAWHSGAAQSNGMGTETDVRAQESEGYMNGCPCALGCEGFSD